MLIQIDTIEILLKRLKSRNWKQNGGYAIRDNPRVLERSSNVIAIVKPIKIEPNKSTFDEIDKFFHTLIRTIVKNKIKNVFLPGGGSIPIPPFFLDYCKEHGIDIHVITNDNLNQFENWGD